MNKFLALAAAVVVGFTLNVGDAEAAKRLGGGGSTGMQRQATPPAKNTQAAPAQQQQQAAPTQAGATAAAPAAQPKRSWLGPVAGLAAGLGLAALASHFGFGEELASFMLMALLALVVVAVIGFIMRKKAAAQAQGGMQYAAAGAGAGGSAPRPEFTPAGGASTAPMAAAAAGAVAGAAVAGNIPADFDAESFARNAKVNFIRLQAANDAANLDDIREFTTPEMFAEIKLAIDERKGAPQQTDVVELNAQVIDVAEEGNRYVVSVHFSGLIREDSAAAAESFSEIWHLTKPADGSRGWTVAGIQQVQ
ncbi:Tim44 domain-containing protein [Azospira restricta]|uniref:Tim44 domain-containing protein n=1 Tax=Azospira restricta TaxID=404405 RepID=A0A974SPQ9_9RHOO|nr:Tim44-like domain-containing protein [Azospira restricta]QRJ64165.1 Tim44 domain-containing protein [Azospira restricta]